MEIQNLIETLNSAWTEQGCLGRTRRGEVDPIGLEHLLAMLNSVSLTESDLTINREFVRLLWFIPLFLSWQTQRVGEKGENVKHFEEIINQFTDTVFAILGVP